MIEQIYEALTKMPKEYIQNIILQLMEENKISFSEIAETHVKHLEELRRGNTDELMKLRSSIISLWCGTKKELPSKLVLLIQQGKDEGWVNITQDKIDKSKWNGSKKV